MNQLKRDDFDECFINEMNRLASEGDTTNLNTYKICAFQKESDWFGVNLKKLSIKSNNEYGAWLQLRQIFLDASKPRKKPYDIYFKSLLTDLVYDDIIDGELNESEITITDFVRIYINNFKQNDTLWIECQ